MSLRAVEAANLIDGLIEDEVMFPAEQFLRIARRRGEELALCTQGAEWSYAQLERHSRSLAEQLQDLGVGPGERVGIDLGNDAAAVAAIWATLRLGSAFACLDPSTPDSAWTRLIEDFTPRVVLTRRQRLYGIEVPPGPAYLTDSRTSDSFENSFDLFRTPDDRSLEFEGDASELPANLVYTSGSTGQPKAVVLSHAAMTWAVRTIGRYLALDSDDVVLNVLPLSFDYGLYQVLLCGSVGACLALEPGMGYPGPLLEIIRERSVTTLPGVPSMFQMLLQRGSFEGRQMPSLRRFTNTGAHLPLNAVKSLRRRFPRADLYLMYGLTECKRVSYLPPEQVDVHPDSVGYPMDGCQAAIVDEFGERLGPNRVGQLVLRSKSMMMGYWGKPEETRRVLRPGPWPDEDCLWTGDLFLRDGSGLLYFVGRMDDVFKSRGEKVAPVEVERVLCASEQVDQAAVVSAPDAILGARIHAYVVAAGGCSPTERELKRHCGLRLEPFKVPHHIHLLPRLPVNTRGKVDRAVLAAMALSGESSNSPEGS